MSDKIEREVAELEFKRFADAMDLDLDPAGMDKDDGQDFEQHQNRMLNAIQLGSLVISENGEPIFTPQRTNDAEPITFYEPTGASLMAMDRKKKAEDIGKMYAAMADMTKTSIKKFSTMKMADLKVCLTIATLFLA